MTLGLGLDRRVVDLYPSYYTALELCRGAIARPHGAIDGHEAE